jgi:hypothetical protein
VYSLVKQREDWKINGRVDPADLQSRQNSNEPLATDEIVERVKQPRHLVIHRLRKLAMEGKIRGKTNEGRGKLDLVGISLILITCPLAFTDTLI